MFRLVSLFFIIICHYLLFPSYTDAKCDSTRRTNVLLGVEQTNVYLPMLKNKRIALVINHTSAVKQNEEKWIPLPDTLIKCNVDIRCIMAPEHGYRGTTGAGTHVADTNDPATGLPIYSLYGKTKKPQAEWLKDVDLIVFDMQDVGTRFYTYLSTLFYVLEACGEQGKELLILDRPNPNDTIDGPTRKKEFKSFVGIIPIPILHGCTFGELAQMTIGEKWITQSPPKLYIIKCKGWKHGEKYNLPIAPSPNLPTPQAISLYPSLCLFEGTDVSVGRGTDFPFEVFGHPKMTGQFTFTPMPSPSNQKPLQQGKLCRGEDLRAVTPNNGFYLTYLIQASLQLGQGWITHPNFFDMLAGSDSLRHQLERGLNEEEIRLSWQEDLYNYRVIRKKYLLYEEKTR